MPDPAIPTPLSNGTTDIPAGPPPVPAGFSDAPPSAPPVPSGFSDQSPQTVQPEPSMLEKAGSIAGDLVTGAGKGLMSTVEGLGNIIKKGITATSPGNHEDQAKLMEKAIPEAGLKAEDTMTHPQGAAQMIGYGGENLAEFLLGDEALKGLSMADKFKQISGVMGIMEKSPRLMKMLQMGVDVGKAATELGPEEQAALKKSPILARLVGTGMDAIRQGVVQGAQTTAKTGGNVKKAAEEGGATALSSGVLGSAFGVLGRATEKAGEAGEAVKEASEAAANAPTKDTIGKQVASQIQDADTKMHGDFEAGIQDLKGKLGDAKVPYQGSPLQKAAQEALQGKTEAKGVLGGEFNQIAGGSNESKSLLTALTDEKKTGDLNIDELVQRRQQLGEKIGQLTKGATSSADRADVGVYRKLRDGIDQTIESLAKQSDSPEASNDYKALRDAYHAKVNLFKEPVIRAMQDGDLDSAGKYLLAGGKTLDKVKTLEQVIGPDGVKQFGQHIAQSVMADASPEGQYKSREVHERMEED